MKIADVTPILVYFVLPLLLGVLLWIGFTTAIYLQYRLDMAKNDLALLQARLGEDRDRDEPRIINIDTAFEGRRP